MKKNKKLIFIFLIGFLLVAVFVNRAKTYQYNSSQHINQNLSNLINSTTSDNSIKRLNKVSSLTGESCVNSQKRPYAVFLENDPVARPLSGLDSADLVIEMPVYTGITRLLTFYQCAIPEEVGSIRSARYDFITLAKNFDAILVHFGGEKSALDVLNQHIIDNINGLIYDGIYFYRKIDIDSPHNAFTNFNLLDDARDKLNYRKESNPNKTFIFYDPLKDNLDNIVSLGKTSQIQIIYGKGYDIRWTYDSSIDGYFRERDSSYELDKITKKVVSFKNILVLFTQSSPINDLYNKVKVLGEGKLFYFYKGVKVEGTWYKKDFDSPLQFFGKDGSTLKLAMGKTWIEYADQNSQVLVK